MKKQILLLVIFILATFANVNVSWGQGATIGSTPRGTNCVGTALTPIAGQPYVYKAASNQLGNYTFWATKDVNFISMVAGVPTTNIDKKLNSPTTTPIGADLLTTSANYGASNAADEVTVTWSDATLNGTTALAPTFVAVNQDGTCTNNFKAWSITPIKAFTVDIRNIDNAAPTIPLAYDAVESQCFDKVNSATFVSPNVVYDFGTQILYFEVIAANFTDSYTPTFQISGLNSVQTATIAWDVVPGFTSATAPVAIVNSTPVTAAAPVTTAVTNTSTGVSIYVMVTIKNNTFQGIAPTPITLAVDSQNSVGDWDIDNGNGSTCTAAVAADQKDIAMQTLDPRPNVTPVAPTPFVTGNETN